MDVDTLISKIYGRRAIWDRFCKAHSNRKMLEKSWQDIAREMDEDENAIKRKWKYLRDQFSVELGKVHACRSGSGAEISFTSKWPFFESLLFLKNVVKPRTSPGVLTRFVNARIDESVDGDEVIDLGPDIHDIKVDYSPASSHSALAASPEQSIMSQIQSPAPPKKTKTSHKGQFQKSMLNIEKEKLKYLQKSAERRREDIDEDEMFFSSLLPHVRKIPPSKKMSFRTKIQKIVDEFAYRQQSSPSPSLRSWDSYTNAEQSQNE